MMGLKLRVQLCHGDVFFFYCCILYHNITTVEGNRNSVNLFCNSTTICWAKIILKGEEESGRKAKRACYG